MPCTVCEGEPGWLPSECPGTVLTAYEKERVGKGWLDFRGGLWIRKVKPPRFIGTMEQVTQYLQERLLLPE